MIGRSAFRVSRFAPGEPRLRRLAAVLARAAHYGRVFSRRHIKAGDVSSVGPVPLETRNPEPETFYDQDFFRKLDHLRLVAKRLVRSTGRGEHATFRKGFSLEFSDYRRYQRGDDLRYVDWNVYRRLEKLLVKVFTAEEEMFVYLLIDGSRSMADGAPSKIDYARKVAGAMGYIALKNLDRVGGAAFGAGLKGTLRVGRGRKQVLELFRFLGGVSCAGETDFRASFRLFDRLFQQPGLVVVVSDFFDPEGWRAALEHLASRKHQLLAIHVVAEEEIHPATSGDVALVDVETGRQRKLFLDEGAARRFQRELDAYFGEIEQLCGRRGIDYLRTTTGVPFEDFVLRTLRQASSVT